MIPESPIKRFHPQWHSLSLVGKTQYLLASCQARDYSEARSMLSRHGHITKLRRKLRMAETATGPRRERLVREIGDSIGSVTQTTTCTKCDKPIFEVTLHADGRREHTLLADHGRVGRDPYCLTCINAMVEAGEVEAKETPERKAA